LWLARGSGGAAGKGEGQQERGKKRKAGSVLGSKKENIMKTGPLGGGRFAGEKGRQSRGPGKLWRKKRATFTTPRRKN